MFLEPNFKKGRQGRLLEWSTGREVVSHVIKERVKKSQVVLFVEVEAWWDLILQVSEGLFYGIVGTFTLYGSGIEFRFLLVKRENPLSIKIAKKMEFAAFWEILHYSKYSGHLLEIYVQFKPVTLFHPQGNSDSVILAVN